MEEEGVKKKRVKTCSSVLCRRCSRSYIIAQYTHKVLRPSKFEAIIIKKNDVLVKPLEEVLPDICEGRRENENDSCRHFN